MMKVRTAGTGGDLRRKRTKGKKAKYNSMIVPTLTNGSETMTCSQWLSMY